MKFLNKLLKRKEEKESASREQAASRVEKQTERSEIKLDKIPTSIITNVIRAPRLTEKTAALASIDKFVFTVAPRANKILVKQAVEGRFGVKVKKVRMLKTFGKERKRGRQIGWKPGIKKAVVTLEAGQKIEFT